MDATWLETNRICTVLGSHECGRITAIEVEDFKVAVAVECRDGVRWYSDRDITSSKAAAATRIAGMRDDLSIEVINTSGADGSLQEDNG